MTELKTAKDLQEDYDSAISEIANDTRENTWKDAMRVVLNYVTRIDAAETALAAANATIERLEWREITPENMPELDDEIGRWHKNNFWQVCSDFASHSIEDYQTEYEGGGWTHFRPVDSPARKAAQ